MEERRKHINLDSSQTSMLPQVLIEYSHKEKKNWSNGSGKMKMGGHLFEGLGPPQRRNSERAQIWLENWLELN